MKTRPSYGVATELFLAAILAGALVAFPAPYPFSAVLLLVSQALFALLLHCPAHYLTGMALGIRFRSMKLGRSTMRRAFPTYLQGLASLLVVAYLVTERGSLKAAPPKARRAMFLSGVTVSIASVVVFAAGVSYVGGPFAIPSLVTWGFAAVYVMFNAVMSPKSGDLMRAEKSAQGSLL